MITPFIYESVLMIALRRIRTAKRLGHKRGIFLKEMLRYASHKTWRIWKFVRCGAHIVGDQD